VSGECCIHAERFLAARHVMRAQQGMPVGIASNPPPAPAMRACHDMYQLP
jgi:hypothetical protein